MITHQTSAFSFVPPDPESLPAPSNIVVRMLAPELERAAHALWSNYAVLDLKVHTTLQNAAQDLLAAMPVVDGLENEIRQMVAELTEDVRRELRDTEEADAAPILLRFVNQSGSDDILSIVPPDEKTRIAVVPIDDQSSLHATVHNDAVRQTVSDILHHVRDRWVLIADPSALPPDRNDQEEQARHQGPLTQAQAEAYRNIARMLNQAMADAMVSFEAQTALVGLAGSVHQMVQRLTNYLATAATRTNQADASSLTAVRESAAIRQNAMQIERQLMGQIGNTNLSDTLRQTLRSGLKQLQKARADVPQGKAQLANVATPRMQALPARDGLAAPTLLSAALVVKAQPAGASTLTSAGRSQAVSIRTPATSSAHVVRLTTGDGKAVLATGVAKATPERGVVLLFPAMKEHAVASTQRATLVTVGEIGRSEGQNARIVLRGQDRVADVNVAGSIQNSTLQLSAVGPASSAAIAQLAGPTAITGTIKGRHLSNGQAVVGQTQSSLSHRQISTVADVPSATARSGSFVHSAESRSVSLVVADTRASTTLESRATSIASEARTADVQVSIASESRTASVPSEARTDASGRFGGDQGVSVRSTSATPNRSADPVLERTSDVILRQSVQGGSAFLSVDNKTIYSARVDSGALGMGRPVSGREQSVETTTLGRDASARSFAATVADVPSGKIAADVSPRERRAVVAAVTESAPSEMRSLDALTRDRQTKTEATPASIANLTNGERNVIVESRGRAANTVRVEPIRALVQGSQDVARDKEVIGKFQTAAKGACAGCGGGDCASCRRPVTANAESVKSRFANLAKG